MKTFSISDTLTGVELPSYTAMLLQRVVATVYARQVIDFFICNSIADDLIELHEQLVSISGANTAYINEIDYFEEALNLIPGALYLKRIEFTREEKIATETEFLSVQQTRYFHCEATSNDDALNSFKEAHPEGSLNAIKSFQFISKSILKHNFTPVINEHYRHLYRNLT